MNHTRAQLQICVLPTQSGKTFQCLSCIEKEIGAASEHSVHIVFTMNTMAGNDQFTTRALRSLAKVQDAGACVLSSRRSKSVADSGAVHARTLRELKGIISDVSPPRVVVMCGHPRRFNDGFELCHFIEGINQTKLPEHIRRVHVYYDEIHKYCLLYTSPSPRDS